MQEYINTLMQYQKPILSVITIIVILIIYLFLERILTRIIRKNENVILDDISTGIKLFSRFFAGYFFVISIVSIYNLGGEILVLLTGLVATIVSLSSIQVINNFLAGLVIIILQPFEVNDYINAGGFEGRVTKITLNYTKIITINDAFVLFPNRIVLRADLINYSTKKKKKKDNNNYLADVRDLLDHLNDDKLTSYNFSIAIPMDNLSDILTNLKKLCAENKEKFGIEPSFFLYNIGYKVEYQFVIKSTDSELIRKNLKEFRNSVLKTIYPSN
jgi:small conductance mechanosensitive channel